MTATKTIAATERRRPVQRLLCRAGGSATAAIIVIQEIFGVNAGIRRKCDTLAEAGYLAVAPDLFHKIAPGIELDPTFPTRCNRRST